MIYYDGDVIFEAQVPKIHCMLIFFDSFLMVLVYLILVLQCLLVFFIAMESIVVLLKS